jgi:CRP-like cAMP-binding protein
MKIEQDIKTCDKCLSCHKTVFKHLNPEDLKMLNDEKSCYSFSKGEVIYHENTWLSGFYCVSDGIVKIYKTGKEGKEQIIKFTQKGDIFGYRSTLNNERACSSAKVIENASVCLISAKAIQALIKSNPSFSLELVQLICKELGEANCFITDIAQKTVRRRLAEILLQLKSSFGVRDDNSLNISLTREELANIVGTATESVIRLLSEFKSDGYIALSGKRIIILNEASLKKLGDTC